MEDPLDILCMNCQEMISYSKIAAHSNVCVFPPDNIFVLEKSSEMMQIQFKLEKLKAALQELTRKKTLNESYSYKYLLTKTKELLSITDPSTDSVEWANAVMISVKKFSKTMIKPGLIIYSERLRELAHSKTLFIIETLAKSGCSKEIYKLLKKKQAELVQMHSEADEKLKNYTTSKKLTEDLHNIDEIASQISRVITQRSSTNSVLSPDGEEGDEYDINEIEEMRQEKEREHNERTIEDLHKYFYSKCLMIKLSYSSRHPSQFIQINELYKKVKALDVPMEKWEEFIKNEFNHPERWVKSQGNS